MKREAMILGFVVSSIMVVGITFGKDVRTSETPDAIVDEEFQHPADEALGRELDGLIAALGDALYNERQASSGRLIELGVRALPHLRDAYRSTDDLEVRLRIEEIVLAIFLDFHVCNRYGYLGVSLEPYSREAANQAGPVVPESRTGVFLRTITENTAASRAGLMQKDVIIAIDGVPCEGAGIQLRNAVAASVRAHKPGTTMMLTVIRLSKTLEIEVIVGRAPKQQRQRAGVKIIEISDLLSQTKASFPEWWVRNFRSSVTMGQAKERGS